ncbi:hypothetical protein [Hansschlegelia sp.]|uniref:hypothetical protein n=1 Tax=Hansschlegelia sp. TaxID=2041892 RepID=UPI002BDA73FB|nr:hypothetical protein [Hansschlegelia sp.]HVI28107.1 hypothetical protein [Hansschlegelia sp.]
MTVRTPSTLDEREPDAEAKRDRTLWLAVISQALEDATIVRSNVSDIDRQQARSWLTAMSADYREVCALAGLEPDHLRGHAERLISQVDAGTREHHQRPALKRSASRSATPRVQTERVRKSTAGASLTFNGRTQILKFWASELGIPVHVIRSRVQYGWPADRILTEPVNARRGRPRTSDRGVGRAQDVNAGTGAHRTAQISG